jgi:hypothetical protein
MDVRDLDLDRESQGSCQIDEHCFDIIRRARRGASLSKEWPPSPFAIQAPGYTPEQRAHI